MATRLILTEQEGACRGQVFVVAGHEEVVMGRAPGCSLRMGDATVSRRHCLLDIGGQWAWVRDLGSRNGTFVNGQDIGRPPEQTPTLRGFRRLRDGDELRVGTHVFRVGVSAEGPDEGDAALRVDAELCGAATSGAFC